MKELTCNTCGDTVVMPKDEHSSEKVSRGETPLEHMNRTGHSPKQPVMMQCNGCENVWPYTGNAERPTCPNCDGKRTERVSEK